MPDAVEAAPSSVETPEIPRSGTPEYAEWRMNGTFPEKVQPKEESAPSEPPEGAASGPEKGKNAPGTEPGVNKQEHRRKPDAESRISQLTQRTKQLERELEEARRPKQTQAEPSPARPAEQVQQFTRTKPAAEDKGQDGKPKYNTYEDFVEDLADWKAEQRIVTRDREQQAAATRQQLGKQLEEARQRYEGFDAIVAPVVSELLKPDIPPSVFAVLNDSPVLADLLYTIGGSEQSKADFIAACRSNPSKALRVALLMEQDITAELAKGKAAPVEPQENGQFVAKPKEPIVPAKRGPESTPAPPLEVGNRSAGSMDEAERAFKSVESGDAGAFRAWKRAQDQADLRRRRGA